MCPLERLATDKLAPPLDLAWNTLLLGQLLAHALGRELSGLFCRELAYDEELPK
jgi:hypothetical protein